MKSNADAIAASMNALLNDPQYQSQFSSAGLLEKLAFKRVADEDVPTELEIEFAKVEQAQSVKTANDDRADCLMCGKKRTAWTEAMGVCKCSSANGCNQMTGCKDGCSCNCKVKQAEVSMNSDMLVKSTVDSLLKVSDELDQAGFDLLSARALVLVNQLVSEAKAKKEVKKDKKDDKKSKEKAKTDKNMAKDKAVKEKAMKDKAKADKAKKSGK